MAIILLHNPVHIQSDNGFSWQFIQGKQYVPDFLLDHPLIVDSMQDAVIEQSEKKTRESNTLTLPSKEK